MSVHKTHDRFLAIAIAHDGVAQARDGQERVALEDLVEMLLESDNIPATLCFYTEGVRWLTEDSPVLTQLREIGKRGADIVACRSCLAEAGLLDRVALGRLDSQDSIDDILRHAEHTMVV
jgi:intracellular sulfur oxidation DsrE/DsrF family protein